MKKTILYLLAISICAVAENLIPAGDFTHAKENLSDIVVTNGGKVVMSMLAVPELNEISQTANRVDVYGGMHIGPIASFVESYDVNVGVSFRPVMRSGDGAMFTIRTLKE